MPNKYLYDSNGIRSDMWTISWFRDVLGESFAEMAGAQGKCAEEVLNEEAQKVPAGSDGLMTVLDWLAPVSDRYKKGVMIGFDGRHTRAHMYRSLLEAVQNMVSIADVFEPEAADVVLFRKMLPVYQSITQYTDEILKKSYEIFS